MARYLLVCLLALAAACAHAGMGTTEIRSSDGPVTVFYPTTTDDKPVTRGPFTLQLAVDAQPARGNGRLVVFSHGSGGSALTYTDLARRFVQAGYLVAVPEHQGDNWHDMSKVGPPSWKRRPLEVSHAIDAMEADKRFGPLFDNTRVGMYGMSAGGHTALTLAGGRWSPSKLMKHCDEHIAEDFATCAGPSVAQRGNIFDGLKRTITLAVIHTKLADEQWYSHFDPRIVAVVAEVPFAVDFDLASFAQPKAQLGIVQARKDSWLTPKFHSMPVIDACKPCTVVADQMDAGHGSLLSPQVPQLPERLAALLADPPGFDRSQVPKVHAQILEFFERRLP